MPTDKKKKPSGFEEPPGTGGNFWLYALIIIVLAGGVIALMRTLAPPEDDSTGRDALIRTAIREQFTALLEKKDVDKFLSYYSKDFNNGDYTFTTKASEAEQIKGVDFEVTDFYIKFIKAGEEGAEVRYDDSRGYATAFAYTYWKQSTKESIIRKPVEKLGAFLLRKEGKEWKIISDKSIPLKQMEDAEHLMKTNQFSPFIDPKTIVWPPPKTEPKVGATPGKEQVDGAIPPEAGGGAVSHEAVPDNNPDNSGGGA